MDDDIRAEAEDVAAPAGRCVECRRPFGVRAKDGFMVFRFDQTEICTECDRWEKLMASRRYDYSQFRRKL